MRFLLLYSRFVLKDKLANMVTVLGSSGLCGCIHLILHQGTKIQFHCTKLNDYWLTDCKSISQLNPSLPLTFLRRSISTALSKIECSTQVAKEINKLGFVILCQQAWGGITSKYNFLFRFTRNAWTTQTSTLPNWNGEQKWIWTV